MSGGVGTTSVLERRTGRAASSRHTDWSTLAVVLLGTFMTFLDFFIVNVAVPSIQTDLHAGSAAVQLVVAGYGIAFAVGMISGGRLGDLYGRRRMFTIGLALFTVTSAACGLAPSAGALIAARVLQGAAGALLTPQVLAILGTVYTGPRRARAFAAYGFAMGIAGVLGQVLGGALIEADIAGSGWRGIFLINVPVGLVALALVRRHVPESHGDGSSLDLLGGELVTLALVAIVLPLVEGRQHGWPEWTWLSMAASPLLFGVFVLHQRRRLAAGHAPMIDVAMFRHRSLGVGSAVGLTFGLVPPSFFFVLALYLQDGRGFSPLYSGAVFTSVGLGYFVAMVAAGPLSVRLGRQVLALGAGSIAGGCLLLADVAGTSATALLIPGLALAGLGIGLVLVPLSSTALRDVPAAHAGAAAGVLTTSQQVGGALGVAGIGVVFFDALGTVQHAFTVSLVVLAGLTALTAGLVQLLPRQDPARQEPT